VSDHTHTSHAGHGGLSEHAKHEIDQWLAKFPPDRKRSAVLAALRTVQHENGGYLTKESMDAVAVYLGLPPIQVYEVATFYSMFETKPVGRHHISVCTNISCMLCGGDEILATLLAHPRTAETVVQKMWLEFVSLKPDPVEVKRLAADFRRGGYEIKPLVRAMLLSPAFRDPANRGALIKSPIDLIVGSVHMLGLPVPEKTGLVRMLQGLGQVPFDPPNVKGWLGGESWITTYTLLLRQQFLRRMIEATTVASMEGGMMMAPRPNRRADRKQQIAGEDSTKQMQMAERRPVEGRSLRNAGVEVRLGPTLTDVDSATLVRTLLPRQPIDSVDASGPPGAAVAAAMLDTAYQLK